MWHALIEHLEYNEFKFRSIYQLIFEIRELCGHVDATAMGQDGCWLGIKGGTIANGCKLATNGSG